MSIRLYRYKCTKIVSKPLRWKLPRQNVYPRRKLERIPRLATWAAHAAVKFGHEEQSTNKNKQTVPNEESENVEGLPSKLLFIWPFVKIFCISSESSKSGSIFWVHLLSKQFELHSFRLAVTIRSPIRSCRANGRFWWLLVNNCKAWHSNHQFSGAYSLLVLGSVRECYWYVLFLLLLQGGSARSWGDVVFFGKSQKGTPCGVGKIGTYMYNRITSGHW